MTASNLTTEQSCFVDYLLDFYGPGGLYTEERDPFHRPMTRDEARRVTIALGNEKSFEGDSIDREKARDIVLDWRGTGAS